MTASGNPVDLVARWMAVGSLSISALSLLYVILKGRRKISVKANDVHYFSAGEVLESVLAVTVVNTGYRPITIAGYSIDFSDGSILGDGEVFYVDSRRRYNAIDHTSGSDDLPKKIEDGDPANAYFEYDQIGEFMVRIGGDIELKAIYAYDAEHGKHKAKVPKDLKKKIDWLPLEWAASESLSESDDSS